MVCTAIVILEVVRDNERETEGPEEDEALGAGALVVVDGSWATTSSGRASRKAPRRQ